jgi:hypothetical protein
MKFFQLLHVMLDSLHYSNTDINLFSYKAAHKITSRPTKLANIYTFGSFHIQVDTFETDGKHFAFKYIHTFMKSHR